MRLYNCLMTNVWTNTQVFPYKDLLSSTSDSEEIQYEGQNKDQITFKHYLLSAIISDITNENNICNKVTASVDYIWNEWR